VSSPSEAPQPDESPDFVLIGGYDGLAQAFERALVILAMGLACQIEKNPLGDGYVVLADPGNIAPIRHELAAYEQEQALPVPVVVAPREFDAGALPTALWVLSLCVVFWWQREHPGLTGMALSSSQAIFTQGEWWRPFTALFLHADRLHLLSNLASGAFFGTWVCRSVGPWLGWALILAAGTLGNALNAASHFDEPFASLGASTAVFGGLGILTGLAVFHATRDHAGPNKNFRYLVPLGGGLVLLSWLGVGSDPRTDVAGHVCGFAAGTALGVVAGWWRRTAGQP
jgi:membrane associated rhomboid family serine protease